MAWESDEQSNQFARTGRIAIPQDDVQFPDESGESRFRPGSSGCPHDSCAPCEVVGFSCYDDGSPRTAGSAMDMINQDLADSDSDIADRIFGTAAPAADHDSDEEKSNLIDRLFGGGGTARGSDGGSTFSGEVVLQRVLGCGVAQETDSEEGSEAMMDSMADRIFGTSAQAPVLIGDAVGSPSVKDRVASFEEMFGSGGLTRDLTRDQDDLETSRTALTNRIFGGAQTNASPQQRLSDDLDNARETPPKRIFGDAVRREEGADDLGDEPDRERSASTRWIDRGAVDREWAGAACGNTYTVEDDGHVRQELRENLFGGHKDVKDGTVKAC